MQTEQTDDQERARTVLKRFFEFARNEERGSTQQVLHGMLARMAQEIVRLENQMEAQEKLWAQSLNEEHEQAYHEGFADGKAARFKP